VTVAIIGVGKIGKTVARELVNGGEQVVLSARDLSQPQALAKELGQSASAAPVNEAIAAGDIIVLAVWFDQIRGIIAQYKNLFEGKVVVDPSNPFKVDQNGKASRSLPDEQSAGEVVSSLLPPGAHYVKAFGTLSAVMLASGSNRKPVRAVLFYATDDDKAAAVIERLITEAGFDPVKVGGVRDSLRIEVGGDLHTTGGLDGRLLNKSEAQSAVRKVVARAP